LKALSVIQDLRPILRLNIERKNGYENWRSISGFLKVGQELFALLDFRGGILFGIEKSVAIVFNFALSHAWKHPRQHQRKA
jgi:hypothetical protein